MLEYRTGEALAIKCLEAKGFQVIDQTKKPEYWKKDVDITARKDGDSFDIEVKWDGRIYNSNAFFFELMTDIEKSQPGWASYTQADYIFYGDSKRKVFYVFKAEDMREYLERHKGEYEERTAKDYRRDGTVRKQSLGAVVPVGLFRKCYSVQEIDIAQRLQENGF